MSWGMHEAAKKIASGWYSELDTTREINADLGRENEKLREENERFIIKLNAEHIVRQNVESENAKLRDQLEEQKCFAADLERDVRALRELVRHMRCCFDREYTEYGIDFIATRCEDCEYDNASGRCDFDSRMAELGVEL